MGAHLSVRLSMRCAPPPKKPPSATRIDARGPSGLSLSLAYFFVSFLRSASTWRMISAYFSW